MGSEGPDDDHQLKRGPMVRQVRGAGVLVPEEIRWIPATTAGRVERKVVLAGSVIQADALLVRAGIDGVLQQVPVEVGQRVNLDHPADEVLQIDERSAG